MPAKLRQRVTREFVRHYAEMALVMLGGMAVLALPARWGVSQLQPGLEDDPELMLARMGLIMALPMIPWMRWRGHDWQPCLEMCAAMLLPAAGVAALSLAGLVENVELLMTLEHVVMFAAMFAVMIARPQVYSHSYSEQPA